MNTLFFIEVRFQEDKGRVFRYGPYFFQNHALPILIDFLPSQFYGLKYTASLQEEIYDSNKNEFITINTVLIHEEC